jgi:hypothetical protein
MAIPDPRAQLDAREAELIRALRGQEHSTDLDPRMVSLAAEGITRKRMRALARTCPALRRDLGPAYEERFAAFAKTHPPREGGAVADALSFGEAVASEQALSTAAITEMLVIRSSITGTKRELRARRGPYIALRPVRRPPGLIVVIRLPGLGLKVFSTGH